MIGGRVVCPGCGEKNRDQARFCTYCGTTLVQRCPACDTEIVPGGRFCDSCGTAVDPSLQAAPAPSTQTVAARKVVTVLFADLTGSTALEEHMDAESVRAIIDRFYAAMRTEIERHSGRVVKFMGDGVLAAFGVPEVHEDDAARAVDTALAMRTELEALASDLQLDLSLKIGINTGEVVVSVDDDDVVGDAVNVASRLEGAAQPGEILVGEDTWRLTRSTSRYEPVAPLELKGKSEPVPAYRLLAVDERTADSAAAPFVGRESELGRLLDVFQEAVETNSARLVTIVGSPGLGKTRLSRELMSELSDVARVRETRCDPAAAQTFAPIADLMRSAAGISETDSEEAVLEALRSRLPEDDEDRDRIAMRAAAILGVGLAGSTEETFWALRRLIEAAASQQPVVLVLDDIHWAEPLLLDLIEHLAEWIRDAPVLLVGTARPELRDLRPSLVEGGRAAAVIALEGLDRQATAQLALNLLETDELPSELLAKIPASTEGNPLFVRELVRMLVDDDVLVRTSDGWNVTVNVDAIQVPPTISSLLAARVDRLRSDERTVVELASVVGKEFYRGALVDLAPDHVKDLVDGVLESLRRKELVEPVGTYWIDEPVYRFHHVLIRDAAYRRLLKESRAEVHERVAAWLERKTAGVLGEHEELVAYHLEQAADYKRQLGRPDEDLARRAAALLGDAAKRALDRDDLPAAATLSERALAALPLGDEVRSELLLISCEALLSMGDVARGSLVLDELEAHATTPRLAAWRTCFVEQLANLTSPEHLDETVRSVKKAAETLGSLGDEAGAAKAHIVLASTLARLGRFAECEAALDDAITAARAAGDSRQLTATLGFAPHAALWGPNLVSRAGGRCLDIVRLLRITTGSPAVEATSLRCQAVLEAFRGRVDAARRMLRSARRTLTELGLEHELLETDQFAGIVEIVGGDASAALEHLDRAYEGARGTGTDVLAAQCAAQLGRAHLLLGEDETAQRYVEESEQLGSQDLNASIAWRSVKAELLARRGSFTEARRLAEEAVELAERTDALFDHGNACRSLGVVLRAAGDAAGAKGAEDRALALFERKGATALIETQVVPLAPQAPVAVHETSVPAANRCARLFDDAMRRYEEASRDGRLPEFIEWLESASTETSTLEDRRSGLDPIVVGGAAIAERFAAQPNVIAAARRSLIATRGEHLSLTRVAFVGIDDYESEMLWLVEIGADDTTIATVLFDVDDLEGALTELDERYASRARAIMSPLSNACTRIADAHQALVNQARVADLVAKFSDDYVAEDRRSGLMNMVRGVEEAVREWSEVAQAGNVMTQTVLAVRGEHLALFRTHWDVQNSAYEVEHLTVLRTDENGRMAWGAIFDVDDLASALEALDDWYIADGSADPDLVRSIAEFARVYTARDVPGIRSVFSSDLVVTDHRPASSGTLEVEGMMAWLTAAFELTGRAHAYASSFVRVAPGRALVLFEVHGTTNEGMAYETDLYLLVEGSAGLITRAEQFAVDQLDQAISRFDELERARGAPRLGAEPQHATAQVRPNFAARVSAETTQALVRGEREVVRAALSDDIRAHDVRSGVRLAVKGVEPYMEELFSVLDVGVTSITPSLLATRGERLCLNRTLLRGSGDRAFEVEMLDLIEFGPDGLVAAVYRFDPSDLDRALQLLDERFAELEGAVDPDMVRLWRSWYSDFRHGNWESMRTGLSEDLVTVDHRPASLGTIHGADELLAATKQYTDLVTEWEPYIACVYGLRPGCGLFHLSIMARSEDGAELDASLIAITHRVGDRISSFEIFPLDQFDAARARFDALDTRAEISENVASRTMRAVVAAVLRHDWDATGDLLAPDIATQDVRSGVRTTARGRDEVLVDLKSAIDVGVTRIDSAVLATRGERLCLLTTLWTASGDDAYGVETLSAVEVDAAGRVSSIWSFDPSDLDGSLDVLDERYVAHEGSVAPELVHAIAGHNRDCRAGDWASVRRRLADDLVVIEHRPASLGSFASADEMVAAMRTMSRLVEAYRPFVRVVHRLAPWGGVFELDIRGRSIDGAEVDLSMVLVCCTSKGRLTRFEAYATDQFGVALARFEELGRTEPRENAASRAMRQVDRNLIKGDPEASRSLYADDVELYDVRAGVRLTLRGVDARIADMRSAVEVGVRQVETIVVATRGDRLSLHRLTYAGAGDDSYEIEFLSIAELNADGLITSSYRFDGSNLTGALELLDELFVAGEGAPHAETLRVFIRQSAAYRERDWGAYRDGFTEDSVLIDKRLAGVGTIVGPDAQVAYAKTLAEIAPDIVIIHTEVLAASGGRLLVSTSAATATEAGPGSEVASYRVLEVRDGRYARTEVFPFDQREAALARFEELGPRSDESHWVPPNEAFTVGRATTILIQDDDWDGYAEMLAPDVVLEDRRAGLGWSGAGRDVVVDRIRAVRGVQSGNRGRTALCLATRGERLSLERRVLLFERDGASWESDRLIIRGLDDAGRLNVLAFFDPGDLSGAFELLNERFLAGEGQPVAEMAGISAALGRAYHARNWDDYAARIDPFFEFVDNTPAGAGTYRGADDYIRYLRGMLELAPDGQLYALEYTAIERDRLLARMRFIGVSADGGDVELDVYSVYVQRGGRLVRAERFPRSQRAQALARFDELGFQTGGQAPTNACVRLISEQADHFARGDFDAGAALYADDVIWDDRRAGLRATAHGFDATKEAMLSWTSVGFARFRRETIAVRGETLTIERWLVADQTGFETSFPSITEADGQRIKRVVVFDEAQLDEAIAELEELFAAGEGAPYRDVLGAQSRLGSAVRRRDWDAMKEVLADGLVRVDHRLVSLGRMTVDEWIGSQQTLGELVQTISSFVVCHHAIASDRMWSQVRQHAVSAEGSDVEYSFQSVIQVRETKIVLWEVFSDAATEDARARFESLGPEDDTATGWVRPNEVLRQHARQPLTNAAVRYVGGYVRAITERDASFDQYAEDYVFEDRRSGLRSVVRGKEMGLATFRSLLDIGVERFTIEPLAIRGDRLVLNRWLAEGPADSGFTVEVLAVTEVDERGRSRFGVSFDPDDLDQAFSVLDERYAAGEGAAFASTIEFAVGFERAINERRWDDVEFHTEDFVLHDHRPMSLGVERGDEWISALQALIELVPTYRAHVVRFNGLARDRWWSHVLVTGSDTEGAPVDFSFQTVQERRDGKLTRVDIFPDEMADAARACFESAGPQPDDARHWAPENTASRLGAQAVDQMVAKDWPALAATYARDVRMEDRRTGLRWEVSGRAAAIAWAQNAGATIRTGATYARIATWGDRLAVGRITVGDPASDRWTSELLALYELNEDGLVASSLTFDPDDYASVGAEMIARYRAGEGRFAAAVLDVIAALSEALRDRDWDRYQSFLGDDHVHVDHRPVGAGEVVGGARHVAYAKALFELTRNAYLVITEIVRIAPDRAVTQQRLIGTSTEGASVEIAAYRLHVVRDGRITRLESWGPDDRAAAIARFDELGPQPNDSRHWAPENAASKLGAEALLLLAVNDWGTMVARYRPDFRIEDRRTGLRAEVVGRDAVMAYLREAAEVTRTLGTYTRIATWGKRLAIGHLAIGDPARDRWTSELLSLYEIDEHGLGVQTICFDADDLRGAFAELYRRYLDGEGRPYAELLRAFARLGSALRARDWDAYREHAEDDLVMVDHRPAGAGTIRGIDGLMAWGNGLIDLAPDAFMYAVEIVRIAEERVLWQSRVTGNSADAPFEIVSDNLATFRDGRLTRLEHFAVDDRAAAIARFDELGPQPDDESRHWALENAAAVDLVRSEGLDQSDLTEPVLSNLATRVAKRIAAAIRAADRETYAAIHHPDVVTTDRRGGLANRFVGLDAALANFDAFVALFGMADVVHHVVGTRGERLALERHTHIDRDSGFEIEFLAVGEIDDAGRIVEIILFDAGALDDAFDELDDRYLAGEGAPHAAFWSVQLKLLRAHSARDWDALQDCFSEDLAFADHRPASLGRSSGRSVLIDGMRGLAELIPDIRIRIARIVAISGDAAAVEVVNSGTNESGGDIEVRNIAVGKTSGGRCTVLEFFPLERMGDALARFEELRPTTPPLGNLATRNNAVGIDVIRTGDWDAVRDILAEDVVLEDRRHGVQSRGVGTDAWIDNFRVFWDLGMRPTRSDLLATRGDRLSLTYDAASDPDGNSVAALTLSEVDQAGRTKAIVWFDEDAFDAALGELEERYLSGEGAPYPSWRVGADATQTYNARDWAAFEANAAPGFIAVDHRPASWGTLQGGAEFTRTVSAFVDVVPNMRMWASRIHAIAERVALFELTVTGTSADGVDLEIVTHVVTATNGTQSVRTEMFPEDDLEAALARFEELVQEDDGHREEVRHGVVLENAAFRAAIDNDAAERGDWDAVASMFADDVTIEDRRPVVGNRLVGREAAVSGVRSIFESRPDIAKEPLATRGDRMCLTRDTYTLRDFRIELLSVTEIDESHRISGVVGFDAGALDEAFDELNERYMRSLDPALVPHWSTVVAFGRWYNARDWSALEGLPQPDFIAVNHLPASWGTIEGATEFTRTVRGLVDVSPDIKLFVTHVHRIAPDIALFEMAGKGSSPGGGDVEIVTQTISQSRDGRPVRTEMFPVDRFDDALARYEELRPRPQGVLENACFRVVQRVSDPTVINDLDRVAELLSPTVHFDDRRVGMGWESHTREEMLDVIRSMHSVGIHELTAECLAVRGERLALARLTFRSDTGLEVEAVEIFGLDDEGRIDVFIGFNPQDIGDAFDELDRLYDASGAALPFEESFIATFGAMNARDWETYRSLSSEDIVYVNHHPASVGTLHGIDELTASTLALIDLVPDLRIEYRGLVRTEGDVVLAWIWVHGTNEAGGPVELEYLMLFLFEGDRAPYVEVFPPEQVGAATVRFEELVAEHH